jgi:copper ion binding protein
MKTTLKVTGMSCEHCVKHVTEALESIEGVKKVKVSLKAGEALIDHAEAVPLDAMLQAVSDAGYSAAA